VGKVQRDGPFFRPGRAGRKKPKQIHGWYTAEFWQQLADIAAMACAAYTGRMPRGK